MSVVYFTDVVESNFRKPQMNESFCSKFLGLSSTKDICCTIILPQKNISSKKSWKLNIAMTFHVHDESKKTSKCNCT